MTSATVSNIQTRIYAIAATVTGLNQRRYWPPSFDSAMLPLFVSLVGPATRTALNMNASQFVYERQFSLLVAVATLNQGLPSESAQTAAEAIIESVEDAFLTRTRLQLSANVLDGMKMASLGSDGGIVAREDIPPGLLVVEFPLTVTYHRAVTPAT